MSTHTPGPWTIIDQRATDDDDIPPAIFIESRNVGHIGQIETIEDARLIAAAPELLKVLRDAAEMLDAKRCPLTTSAARAAIAKAEGR